MQILENTEDKAVAIYEAMDRMMSLKNQKLIEELTEQNARAAVDEDYRKSLNLRALSKEETKFYEQFKDIKQAVTTKQIDVLPTSLIDRTLEDIQKNSTVLSLVELHTGRCKTLDYRNTFW